MKSNSRNPYLYNLPPEEEKKRHYVLQPKQRLFAEHMLSGFDVNPGEAAEKAGYDYSMGKALLKNTAILQYIQKRREEITEEMVGPIRVDQQSVLAEMAKIAYANPHDLCDEDADGVWVPKKKSELTRDHAAAIKKLIFTTCPITQRRVLSSVELYDKKAALDSLMKHLGMFEKDNLQKQPTFNINDVVNALPLPDSIKEDVLKKLLQGIEAEQSTMH